MMMGVVLLCFLAILAINIFLWKSGFLHQAEQPEAVADRPLKDPRIRGALLKRIRRWREEGKLSRAEAERLETLCQTEWDALDD